MSERPILIEIESLGALVRGQMLAMGPTNARLKPDEPLFLYNRVRTSVRFRFADIVYSLGGLAISSDRDESFFFDFDDVTRKDMAMLRALGIAAAERERALMLELAEEVPAERRKRSKEEQRQVLRMRPPGGIERRSERRRELEATGMLLLLDKGQMMRCTLLEISLSGCRLYSEVPFSLEDGMRAEIEFVGMGHPFRLAAEIRAKEEEHITGLYFTGMSSRCRQRLMELMGDLTERDMRRVF